MPPKKAKRGSSDADDESDDYKRKRVKNNEAVKKCRLQARQRTQQTFTRVSVLKEENQVLEEKVKTLTKELQNFWRIFPVKRMILIRNECKSHHLEADFASPEVRDALSRSMLRGADV
ncbi:basic region leucine zipper domain-containing protein [Phthorimaea operculella]|nr:basic region leucine zipper domain-containing protein [Phthorimaea operculella]